MGMMAVFGPSSRRATSTYRGTDKSYSPVSHLISISSVVGQVKYTIRVLATLTGPGATGTIQRILRFCREMVSNRLKNGANRKDLFYYLVSANDNPVFQSPTTINIRAARMDRSLSACPQMILC